MFAFLKMSYLKMCLHASGNEPVESERTKIAVRERGRDPRWKGCIGFLQGSLNKDTMRHRGRRWRSEEREIVSPKGEKNEFARKAKEDSLAVLPAGLKLWP